MVTVSYIVLASGTVCEKEYNDVEEAKRFLLKCRHSKKVKAISFDCVWPEDYEYLKWYF